MDFPGSLNITLFSKDLVVSDILRPQFTSIHTEVSKFIGKGYNITYSRKGVSLLELFQRFELFALLNDRISSYSFRIYQSHKISVDIYLQLFH